MLWKHIQSDHKNEENVVEFETFVTNTFKKPLSRIIDEGLRIKNLNKNSLLNSKSEYYGPSIQRKKTYEDQFECEVCKNTVNSKYWLNEHMRNVHSEGKSSCPKCDYETDTKDILNRHMRTEHRSSMTEQTYQQRLCPMWRCSPLTENPRQTPGHPHSRSEIQVGTPWQGLQLWGALQGT